MKPRQDMCALILIICVEIGTGCKLILLLGPNERCGDCGPTSSAGPLREPNHIRFMYGTVGITEPC